MTPPSNKQYIDLSFLEGPRSRWKELQSVVNIAREFIYGFRKLHFVGPCVTFFGSARFKEDHPYYRSRPGTGCTGGTRGLHHHDRRRSGHHGGRQPRCP